MVLQRPSSLLDCFVFICLLAKHFQSAVQLPLFIYLSYGFLLQSLRCRWMFFSLSYSSYLFAGFASFFYVDVHLCVVRSVYEIIYDWTIWWAKAENNIHSFKIDVCICWSLWMHSQNCLTLWRCQLMSFRTFFFVAFFFLIIISYVCCWFKDDEKSRKKKRRPNKIRCLWSVLVAVCVWGTVFWGLKCIFLVICFLRWAFVFSSHPKIYCAHNFVFPLLSLWPC